MILASGFSGASAAIADGASHHRAASGASASGAPEPVARPIRQAEPAFLGGLGARDATAPRDIDAQERHDPDVLTGPTPAFQASVLEIEQDLKASIARLEAARTAHRDEGAIAPRAAPQNAPDAAPVSLPETAQPEPDASSEAATFALEVPYDLGATRPTEMDGPT